MYKQVIFICLAQLILPIVTNGQFMYFDRMYDYDTANSAESATGIIYDLNDSTWYFTGRSQNWALNLSSAILTKVNSQGDTILTRNDNDTINSYIPTALVRTSDNGIVVASTVTNTLTNNRDFNLIKFNSNHEIEFSKNYGDSIKSEQAFHVITTFDKGFLIVGQSLIIPNDSVDVYAVKTDSIGNFEWGNHYGGNASDWAYSAIQTPDSGYFIFGNTHSFGSTDKAFLVKTDSYGNEEWQRSYGSNEGGGGITLLSDGNYLLAGWNGNGRLRKIDGGGDVIWQKTYSYPGSDGNWFEWARELPDKSIIAAGGTNNLIEGNAGWIIKTDSAGILLWERKYNKTENVELFYDFIFTDDNGILLCGQAWNDSADSQDAWLLKVDSMGCEYENCTVGIEDEITNEASINVYPNPSSNSFNINYLLEREASEIRIEAYDLTGKTILVKKVSKSSSGNISLDFGECIGIYVLRMFADDKQVYIEKLVCIQR